jgi:formamidopyrimidine-DNA glycosylase
MPELPEVETVVRTLRPLLCGRLIVGVRTSGLPLRQPWDPAWAAAFRRGRRVVSLRRRGKWILAELSRGATLVFHLGMTGRLQVVPAAQPLEPHTHLVFPLRPGGCELRFHDPRRFGAVGLYRPAELKAFFADRLGADPFRVSVDWLFAQLQKTDRCLKAVLLDQQVLAGVGNIYADESLFAARLHPARPGASVTRREAGRLRRALVQVLRRAIAQNGSTIRDYLYGENGRGSYQNEFRVYAQTGRPCRRCRTPIVQVRLAGRSTHFCPTCQPAQAPGKRRQAAGRR